MLISQTLEQRLASAGQAILRYSLVFFFLAFGLYKFTPQEAAAIAPLMAHSPFLFWTGPLLGEQMASNLIGVVEIAFGVMVALRSVAPRVSAWGSLGIAGALVTTISFLFTTPGLDPASSDAGFLLKDLTLLGAALWSAAEAFAAARVRATTASSSFGQPAPRAG
jgi:reactive chlorine resistance protein C